jgi:Predicted dehydrogenases and related proteins
VRILIVGFGSIGERHYNILKKFNKVSKINVVSRYSKNDNVLCGELSELSNEQLNYYDLFIVSSETSLHEEQFKFIDSKVTGKVILVEKPLAVHVCDYLPQNKVLVAYNLRFHPVVKKLRELMNGETILSFSVAAGQYLPTWRVGRKYEDSYSCYLSRGGGVLRDLSHEIDYTQYLCGELSLHSAMASSRSHLKIAADDLCTILATNCQGAHIQIQMDYLSFRPKREIEVQTDNMTISANLITNKIEVFYPDKDPEFIDLGLCSRDQTYIEMHENMAEFGGTALTSYNDANSVMKLIDVITENFMDQSWV